MLGLLNPEGKLKWRDEKRSLWGLPLDWIYAQYKTLHPLDPQQLFAGQWLDQESGLAYNRFRYYDPETGNYLTSDPIGLNGGETPYGYVHNPMDWVDPFGLEKCKRPGGYKTHDVDEHGLLFPKTNRAPGHTNTAADNRIQSHHPIQQEWAKRNIPGYNSNKAPAILLPSSSGMSHAQISSAQRAFRRSNGYETSIKQEFNEAVRQMQNAGLPEKAIRKTIKQNYKYFELLGAFK